MKHLHTIYLAGFALLTGIRTYHTVRQPQQRPARSDPTERSLLLLQLLGMQLLPLLAIFSRRLAFADYTVPRKLQAASGGAGALALLGAAWLLHRSHTDLDTNWRSELQEQPDQALVTTGVYRLMRHPMYAAHWLWSLAQALLLHNWLAGPAFLATFWPLYRYRVPREEAQMLERFGDDYRDYAARTRRLGWW
jgi:protein-S-isoprenylcysteine O-methyltransferase Ste14